VRFHFADWTLDDATGTLARDGTAVALQHQPAQLLALLLERAGTIVTRDDIQARLWPDTVIEYDQSINYAIRQIRVALGADGALVQTIARRGYRFTGAVARTTDGAPEAATRGGRRVSWWAAGALIAACVFASGFGAGVVSRDGKVGRFVYVHLVHPDRCPYMRFLFPAHRNS